jgi:hypothetical protein
MESNNKKEAGDNNKSEIHKKFEKQNFKNNNSICDIISNGNKKISYNYKSINSDYLEITDTKGQTNPLLPLLGHKRKNNEKKHELFNFQNENLLFNDNKELNLNLNSIQNISDFNIVSKPRSFSEDNESNREIKSPNLSRDSESIMNKMNKTDSDYNGLKKFHQEFIKGQINEINAECQNFFENEDKISINDFYSKNDDPLNKENCLRITDEKDQDFNLFKLNFSSEHSREESNGFIFPHITNTFNLEKSNNNYIPSNNLDSLNNRILNSNNNFQNSQKNIENKNIKNVPDYIELKQFNRKSYNVQTNKNNNDTKKEKNQIKSISEIYDENKDKFNILKDKNIFSKRNDLTDIEENGKVYNNIIKIMTKSDAKNEIDIKKFHPDFIIKTYVKSESLKAINSFEEMEYKIKILKTGNDYLENIGKYFNLTYLEQPLYTVFSNESSQEDEKNNFEKIQYIINKYNQDKQITPLIEHLLMTVQEIIAILTYQKDDKGNIYKSKIFDYAAKEYEKFTMENGVEKIGEDLEFLKKDYIASLILLAFNFKEYFLNKKARTIKERKPQKKKDKKQ